MNEYLKKEYQFLPWNSLTDAEKAEQKTWQNQLSENCPVTFGEDSVVSPEAYLYSVKGAFGKKTLIASHALLRCLEINAGDNCSFNTYCVVHGKVTLGDNVRIAPGAKIFGENHGFEDINKPICTQPNTRKGITVGSDVWIGANAVICDGVTIGAHSIVAAGAVVTKNIPPYSIVGGTPARVISSRLANEKNAPEFTRLIQNFGTWVKENVAGILSAYFIEGEYVNSPCHKEKRRAICDAVEIAGAFGIDLPQITKEEAVAKIKAWQKDENEYECVMSASYALEILGEKPLEFTFVNDLGDTWDYLNSLKWKTDPWDAGHFTDIYATALFMNKKYYNRKNYKHLFAWLGLTQNMDGLWGEGDMNLRVNGYYRLTRGTYDQFKLKPAYVKEAVDTVLKYAENKGVPQNACDALDIIHPLYFAKGFTPYRKSEGEAWCVKMLPEFIHMAEKRGFPFEKGGEASLKGTEMWLSIIYLMCDYLGLSHLLPYEPKGVHRTK